MPLAQDQNAVQTLASDGADEPFREGALPRALRSREDVTDPHALHALLKYVAVDAVALAKEIPQCAVIGESRHDLLGGPVGGGALGHVEVDDASPMVNQHDENEVAGSDPTDQPLRRRREFWRRTGGSRTPPN